jgi:hypothetical protein
MGGWLAWMAGRAIALTWRSNWQLVVYMLILGLFVRFIHFALFQATPLTLHYYIVDTILLIAFGYGRLALHPGEADDAAVSLAVRARRPFGWKPARAPKYDLNCSKEPRELVA